MGLFKKLFKTGATVGATVAAVKVAEKVKENNPGGIKDANGDGKVDASDYVTEIKKAADEVFTGAKEALSEKAPDLAGKAENAFENAKTAVEDLINGVKPGKEPKED